MKKISLLLAILLTFSAFSCKEDASKRVKDENLNIAKERDSHKVTKLPQLTFKSKEFDFGTIKEGDIANAVFEYQNTGESDLIISNARASCGCTVADYPKNTPIKPGEKGVIKAVFDSKGKRNNQNKSITLSTNSMEPKVVIYVKGFVTPDPNAPISKKNSNTKLIEKKPKKLNN